MDTHVPHESARKNGPVLIRKAVCTEIERPLYGQSGRKKGSHGILGTPFSNKLFWNWEPQNHPLFWSYRKNWKPYSEVVTSNLNVKPSAMMVSSPQTHHLPPDNPKNHLYWRLVHGPSWAIPLTSSWPLGNGISFSQAPAGHGLRKQWIWAAKYYRRPQDRWKSETNV